MTQEQIENKAIETAKKACNDFDEVFEYANGFVKGANWRIESVWHTAEDMPSRNMNAGGFGELCIAETSDGSVEFVRAYYEPMNGHYYFKTSFGEEVGLLEISRWAYVSDLLPEE